MPNFALVFWNVNFEEVLDCTMIAAGTPAPRDSRLARDIGTNVRKKPEEIYDNSFVLHLEKSGFTKEIWGSENYKR
jgi:hypothetical protein